jgi:uncharacterized protein YndB with AHSA1/START domain
MKALKWILGGVAALLLVLAGAAALRPNTWHVERSTVMAAPRPVVWALVSDVSRYAEWSPFLKDPEMKKEVVANPGVVGSTYAWDGNAEVGAGKMTYTNAKPGERIDIALEFTRPLPGTNQVAYLLADEAQGTKMTWTMDGTYEGVPGFAGKVLGMLFDMDTMVGGEFEKGLANVKAIAEREAKP